MFLSIVCLQRFLLILKKKHWIWALDLYIEHVGNRKFAVLKLAHLKIPPTSTLSLVSKKTSGIFDLQTRSICKIKDLARPCNICR